MHEGRWYAVTHVHSDCTVPDREGLSEITKRSRGAQTHPTSGGVCQSYCGTPICSNVALCGRRCGVEPSVVAKKNAVNLGDNVSQVGLILQ